MSTTATSPVREHDTVDALQTCASLLRIVAALGGAVDTDRIDVHIGLCGIGVQVPQDGGSAEDRIATVATYADVLGTVVTRDGKWIRARGMRAGHEVKVWTMVEPEPEATETEAGVR